MNNFLLQSKKERLQSTLKQNLTKTDIQNEKRMQMKSLASNSHRNRLIMFSSANTGQLTAQLASSLENGILPLLHIDNHEFRDREKSQEKDPYGGIYIRTFLSSQQRAVKVEKEFLSSHLEIGDYLGNQQQRALNRQRSINLEGPAMRFGLNPRTENERVLSDIGRVNSLVDIQARNMKMAHYPDWKPIKRDKWISKDGKDFDVTTQHFTLAQKSSAWEVQELPKPEKYTDGYEVTGDISRKREKKKEGQRTEFISTIRNDPWETTLHISKSLRAFKAEQAFGTTNYDNYSQNNKIRNYKSTLLSTGSVNHFVPFNHSNSERSSEMQDLLPRTEKLYNKSLKHYQIEVDYIQPQITSQNNSGLKLDFIGENEEQNKETTIKIKTKLGSIKSITSMNDTHKNHDIQEGDNFWKNTLYYRPSDEQVQTVVGKYFQVRDQQDQRNHVSNSSIHSMLQK